MWNKELDLDSAVRNYIYSTLYTVYCIHIHYIIFILWTINLSLQNHRFILMSRIVWSSTQNDQLSDCYPCRFSQDIYFKKMTLIHKKKSQDETTKKVQTKRAVLFIMFKFSKHQIFYSVFYNISFGDNIIEQAVKRLRSQSRIAGY